MALQNQPQSNTDRKNAKLFFITALLLAAFATFIGTTYYSLDSGGPALFIGIAAFGFFIASLVSMQRAGQIEDKRPPTPLRTYSKRILIVILLLPFFLYASWWLAILSWGSGSVLIALLIPIIFIGLLSIIFRHEH